MERIKLNLGCGDHTPKGWINVDYSLGAKLAKLPLFKRLNSKLKIFNMDWDEEILLHDLNTRFPWADGSIHVVYCSHTLEHMTREQGREFLRECHRVLGPGGIVRIAVPDFEVLVKKYNDGELRADRFVEALGVTVDDPQDGPVKRRLAFLIRYPHKCMYDLKSLLGAMEEVGFECRPSAPLRSDIEDIEVVEIRDLTSGSIIVEGKKPT